MRAVFALLDTDVAVAPGSIVACVAVPVTSIRKCLTAIAKQTQLQSCSALVVSSG
jgi:hypothetical protein